MTTEEMEIRLDTLGQSLPPRDPAFAARVLSELPDRVAPSRSIHWLIKSGLGLAASLALIAALWSILITTPQPAYAIADLPQRIRTLNSLHMVGQTFPSDGSPPQPLEYFIRQPTDYRIIGSLSMENFKLVDVSDWINTADGVATVNHLTRTAKTRPQNAEQARGRFKYEMDMLLDQLFGPWTDYHKLRDETLNGTRTEVYQSTLSKFSKKLIWYLPQNGLPMQIEDYETEPGQPDRLTKRIIKIEANLSIADAAFVADIPAGFAITRSKLSTDVDAYGRLTLNTHRLCIRYAGLTPGGDIVLCWALFDKKDPQADQKLSGAGSLVVMSFTSYMGNPLTEQLLHLDASPEGYHWRWSLLRQPKPRQRAGVNFQLTETDHSGSGGGFEVALPIDPKELEAIQRQTLPPGELPWTLGQIEAGKQ